MERRCKEYLAFLAFRALGAVSQRLGWNGRRILGRRIGDAMRHASARRREVTRDNIARAFPERDAAWVDRVVRDSYRNLGITLAELLAFPVMSDAELGNRIRYENIELLHEVHARGRGMLLLSGHFGNWELLAYSAGVLSGLPVTIVVAPQHNEFADRWLNAYRTQRNNEVLPMHQAARGLIRVLRAGGSVAMLADQSATEDKDIFVDFFGRPASTYEAPAAVALRLNTPIVIGFAERDEQGIYRVRLREIDHSDLKADADGVRELTRRHVALLEDAVRKRPDLWSWQHRRWKHEARALELAHDAP